MTRQCKYIYTSGIPGIFRGASLMGATSFGRCERDSLLWSLFCEYHESREGMGLIIKNLDKRIKQLESEDEKSSE